MAAKELRPSEIKDFSSWMSQLPAKYWSLPLNSLAIPGSHDSIASKLNTSGPLGPDCDKVVTDLSRVLGPMMKEIIHRWSLTQSLSISHQLGAGVRYLDIRIASMAGQEDVYCLHGLYGETLEGLLQEVKAFLDEHPKEIVLLDINHIYCLTDFQHKQCLSMILEILGYKMCPLLDMDSVTLETMWDSHLQALVFYDNDIVYDYPQFWPGDSMPSPWANVTETSKLIKFLEENYKKGRPEGKFYVTQGILTPDASTILANLTSSLKKAMSDKVVQPFIGWLRTKTAGKQGINICILDFVEMEQYIPHVIALNDDIV